MRRDECEVDGMGERSREYTMYRRFGSWEYKVLQRYFVARLLGKIERMIILDV